MKFKVNYKLIHNGVQYGKNEVIEDHRELHIAFPTRFSLIEEVEEVKPQPKKEKKIQKVEQPPIEPEKETIEEEELVQEEEFDEDDWDDEDDEPQSFLKKEKSKSGDGFHVVNTETGKRINRKTLTEEESDSLILENE